MDDFSDRKDSEDSHAANRAFFRNRDPQSLHEARVMAHAVRIEPGRYRVVDNTTLEVSHLIMQPTSTSRLGLASDPRPRRPLKGYGDGQPLGKPVISETPFTKVMEYMPGRPRKRVYFNDRDDSEYEEITTSPRKNIRAIKRVSIHQFKKYDDKYVNSSQPDGSSSHSGIAADDYAVSADKESLNKMVHNELDDDGLSNTDYVEEVVDVMDDEQEQDPDGSDRNVYISAFERNSMSDMPSMTVGTVSIVKQLRGENNYLKDQLDAAFSRIKQLESLLLEKNQRLKQLLTENVQSSIKVQKLVKALGEDEAASVLNQRQAKPNR